jgi:hypothetical protein
MMLGGDNPPRIPPILEPVTRMAQQVTTSFIDDIDGSAAEGTVAFAIDGKMYDIDLSAANAARLRDVFAPYVGAARRAGRGRQPRRRASTRTSEREENQAIRAWAEAEGMTVSARGRIPGRVLEAYRSRDAQPRRSPALKRHRPPCPRRSRGGERRRPQTSRRASLLSGPIPSSSGTAAQGRAPSAHGGPAFVRLTSFANCPCAESSNEPSPSQRRTQALY